MTSGIYAITNTINGHEYIGSAKNVRSRLSKHFSALGLGKHENQHLQHAYDKYGKDNFSSRIVIICDKENLVMFEQWAMDSLHPAYNIRKIANSNIGIKLGPQAPRSAETRRKLSEGRKGKPHTEETRKKISAARTGKPLSEEHKKKLSITNTGRMHTQEVKDRLCVSRLRPTNINLVHEETGEIVLGITNIKQFIRERGYKKGSSGTFYYMIQGKYQSAQGWRLYDESIWLI